MHGHGGVEVRHGRHAAPGKRAASRAVLHGGICAARRASAGAVWAWRRLGLPGQLVTVTIACMTIGGRLAGDVRLVPDAGWWPDIAGAVMAAVYLAVRVGRQKLATRRGQREFAGAMRSGRAVLQGGGWEKVAERAARVAERQDAGYARLGLLEGDHAALRDEVGTLRGKLDDLFTIWAAELRAEQPASRHLRLVSDQQPHSRAGA